MTTMTPQQTMAFMRTICDVPPMKEVTPQQAVHLLRRSVAGIPLSLSQHLDLQEAALAAMQFIEENRAKPEMVSPVKKESDDSSKPRISEAK